jgi:hypothetical protein
LREKPLPKVVLLLKYGPTNIMRGGKMNLEQGMPVEQIVGILNRRWTEVVNVFSFDCIAAI